jgi:3'(2'), 5'-bisphosphate nucleotidase
LTWPQAVPKISSVLAGDWWHETADEVIALARKFRDRLGTLSVSAKPDDTLLTEADIAVQDLIIQRIRKYDTDSRIVAEEDGQGSPGKRSAESTTVWIVDPIDGTSQFVQPDAVEYCTVIARYDDGHPSAALVVAPEWGAGRVPIVVMVLLESCSVTVNHEVYRPPTIQRPTGHASTTRSTSSSPSEIETSLRFMHYEVKTRTTSQTLDMVRTALDLREVSPDAWPFDLFHRRQQKLWDGAAGICLATTIGLTAVDENKQPLIPLSSSLLAADTPILASSVVGHHELIDDLLGQ